jgi:hypothetical protein
MNKLIPVKIRRLDARQAEHHGFGLVDKRGRQIGAVIYRFSVEVTETDDRDSYEVRHVWQNQIGTQYVVSFHATRDGVSFGGGKSDKWFATEAEREDAIRKYLQNAKARAAKAA